MRLQIIPKRKSYHSKSVLTINIGRYTVYTPKKILLVIILVYLNSFKKNFH